MLRDARLMEPAAAIDAAIHVPPGRFAFAAGVGRWSERREERGARFDGGIGTHCAAANRGRDRGFSRHGGYGVVGAPAQAILAHNIDNVDIVRRERSVVHRGLRAVGALDSRRWAAHQTQIVAVQAIALEAKIGEVLLKQADHVVDRQRRTEPCVTELRAHPTCHDAYGPF